MKVSFVILTYNSEEMIKLSLEELVKNVIPEEAEIIVIDNGSHDSSVAVAQSFPQVHVKKLQKNIFFSAMNESLSMVTGDIIVIMNPDIMMPRETFLEMIRYFDEHPTVVAAGPRHIRADGSIERTARLVNLPSHCFWTQTLAQAFWPKKRHQLYDQLTSPSLAEPSGGSIKVEVLQDSCLWVRTQAFKQIGGYSSSLKLYYTEDDLCMRLSSLGDLMYLPQVKVMHFQGSSVRKEPSFFIRQIMSFDMLEYLKQHFGLIIYLIFIPLTYLSLAAWWIVKTFWVRSKHYSLRG